MGELMKRHLVIVATLIAALGMVGMTGHSAEAATKKKARVVVTPAPTPLTPWGWWWSGLRDPQVAAAHTVVSAGATGAAFALRHNAPAGLGTVGGAYAATSFGCAVISPIVSTMVVKRELSRREVWVMTANCFVPFIGGWWVNAALDANPNPLWDKIGP
jgi:hypothetical protein